MKKITIAFLSLFALTMTACSSYQVKTAPVPASTVKFSEVDGLLQAVVVNPSTISAK